MTQSALETLLATEPDNHKIAKLIGCTPSAVSHWRRGDNGHSSMTEAAAKLALEKYETKDADNPLLIVEDSDRVRRLLAIAKVDFVEV